ncbi:MAG: hypothetical protein KC496_20150, partial [Anaerolineae bacterium]|nr:hypothetical protein [Anaerolineae bacterium]
MPVHHHTIIEYANSLGVTLPLQETFWELGDLTALRQASDGRFYRSNYERGMLLYALVAHHRPAHVLEFGTGRGYGSLCMAWAMHDHDINGQIYSVDVLTADTPIEWAIDRHDGAGPVLRTLTWNEVWEQAAPPQWRGHLVLLNGDSSTVMQRETLPPMNLVFIDGG